MENTQPIDLSASDDSLPVSRWSTIIWFLLTVLCMLVLPTLITSIAQWADSLKNAGYSFSDHLGRIWPSLQEVIARAWLLAGFFATGIVTLAVNTAIKNDGRFDDVRKDWLFRVLSLANSGLAYVILLVPFGIVVAASPNDGIRWLKYAALGTACWMLVIDSLLWWMFSERARRRPDKYLERQFRRTSLLVDLPTALAIIMVLYLSSRYADILPLTGVDVAPLCPCLAKVETDRIRVGSEMFLVGLSSGAVAVELWFANFVYWMLFRID